MPGTPTLLADLAYARAGDKGDTSTIGVLARNPEAYERIRRLLTPERVLAHFGGWAASAEVYEMPNIQAVQVVLRGALGGGATTTLRLDQTGKAMANNLLRMRLDAPQGDAVDVVAFPETSFYERYWDDFPAGLTLRTRGITVTEAHIAIWSMVAGDWLPIHVDREHAKQTTFGEPVAHGPLTLSLALGLVTQSGVYGDAIVAWLGLDEVRLPAPVRIGDTIHVEVSVEDQVETSNRSRGRVRIAYEVRNQRDETVMTFTSSFLMRRRPE